MTGYTVHTGSTEKFAAGWDQIFKAGKVGKGGQAKKKGARKVAKPARKKARKK